MIPTASLWHNFQINDAQHLQKGVYTSINPTGVVFIWGLGWSGSAMVLGEHSVPRRPTIIWIIAGQGPTALTLGAGRGCLDIFTLIYHYSPFSPSLWETARYRLKYCLKRPLNPKPTNQPTKMYSYAAFFSRLSFFIF